MISKGIVALITCAFILASCEKIAMNPKPETDNLSLFNEYSNICIEKFALQEVKNINLTTLSDSLKLFITPSLNQKELFDYMGVITKRMQEGHTSLNAIQEGYFENHNWFENYPSANNSFITSQYYYGDRANSNVQKIIDSNFEVWYGYLPQNSELGYIRVTGFKMDITDAAFEQMMFYLKEAKGIIIDVRGNVGGYINLGARLASYFTLQEVVFANNYIKNGPNPGDYANSQMKIIPSGSDYTYTKPVVVLQDRRTFSTGSVFVIMMSALKNTLTIGQTYGGGTGEIIDGLLTNGWKYTLSTSNLIDINKRPTDNGNEAEISMIINPEDTDIDAIIERAIIELQ